MHFFDINNQEVIIGNVVQGSAGRIAEVIKIEVVEDILYATIETLDEFKQIGLVSQEVMRNQFTKIAESLEEYEQQTPAE